MRTSIVAVALLVAACGGAGASVADGTPADLHQLVEETFPEIEAALPAHVRCLDGLTVTHAWELDDRAEYQTATATVVLRVPATGPELQFSLAHEVAHHIDFGCGLPEGFRDAFRSAQGLDSATTWERADSWESTPAELFATAVAAHVTGQSDPLRAIVVADEAMALVEEWADGAFRHQP